MNSLLANIAEECGSRMKRRQIAEAKKCATVKYCTVQEGVQRKASNKIIKGSQGFDGKSL
ncbi:MAG: hypothetical protein ACLR7D_06245 [Lachnospira eligens]